MQVNIYAKIKNCQISFSFIVRMMHGSPLLYVGPTSLSVPCSKTQSQMDRQTDSFVGGLSPLPALAIVYLPLFML